MRRVSGISYFFKLPRGSDSPGYAFVNTSARDMQILAYLTLSCADIPDIRAGGAALSARQRSISIASP